jgi:hypothetical protein
MTTRLGVITDSLVELVEHLDRSVGAGRSDPEAIAGTAQLVLLDAALRRVQDWHDEHPSLPRRA